MQVGEQWRQLTQEQRANWCFDPPTKKSQTRPDSSSGREGDGRGGSHALGGRVRGGVTLWGGEERAGAAHTVLGAGGSGGAKRDDGGGSGGARRDEGGGYSEAELSNLKFDSSVFDSPAWSRNKTSSSTSTHTYALSSSQLTHLGPHGGSHQGSHSLGFLGPAAAHALCMGSGLGREVSSSGRELGSNSASGFATHFTCFISTKVQILRQRELSLTRSFYRLSLGSWSRPERY